MSNGAMYHWEGRDGGRIVLWNRHEKEMVLELTIEEARKALDHLSLLICLAERDD